VFYGKQPLSLLCPPLMKLGDWPRGVSPSFQSFLIFIYSMVISLKNEFFVRHFVLLVGASTSHKEELEAPTSNVAKTLKRSGGGLPPPPPPRRILSTKPHGLNRLAGPNLADMLSRHQIYFPYPESLSVAASQNTWLLAFLSGPPPFS